jgi:acyl carrier protein phosphodiesterase
MQTFAAAGFYYFCFSLHFLYEVYVKLMEQQITQFLLILKKMNYLAHAYLSFNQPEILVGNMISDFVKGKKKFEYPATVQKGIALHRSIDEFTDEHAATRQAKEIFRANYRLYSGAFVDVVYDHFLAIDTNEFTDESLLNFTQSTYQQLSAYTILFPEKFHKMFPYMQAQNWLYNYRFNWGIEKSFGGLVRRSVYLTESDKAFELFENNYRVLQQCYAEFFPAVKKHAQEKLNQLIAAG